MCSYYSKGLILGDKTFLSQQLQGLVMHQTTLNSTVFWGFFPIPFVTPA